MESCSPPTPTRPVRPASSWASTAPGPGSTRSRSAAVWPRARAARLIVAYVPPFNVLVVPALAGRPRGRANPPRRRGGRPAARGPGARGVRRLGAAHPPRDSRRPAACTSWPTKMDADLIVVGSTHRRGLGRDRARHDGREAPARLPPPRARGARRLARVERRRVRRARRRLRRLAAIEERAVGRRRAGARDRRLAARDRRVRAPHPANPIFALTSHGYGEIVGDLRDMLADRLEDAVADAPARRRRPHRGHRRRPGGRPRRASPRSSTCSRWDPAATGRCAPSCSAPTRASSSGGAAARSSSSREVSSIRSSRSSLAGARQPPDAPALLHPGHRQDDQRGRGRERERARVDRARTRTRRA